MWDLVLGSAAFLAGGGLGTLVTSLHHKAQNKTIRPDTRSVEEKKRIPENPSVEDLLDIDNRVAIVSHRITKRLPEPPMGYMWKISREKVNRKSGDISIDISLYLMDMVTSESKKIFTRSVCFATHKSKSVDLLTLLTDVTIRGGARRLLLDIIPADFATEAEKVIQKTKLDNFVEDEEFVF